MQMVVIRMLSPPPPPCPPTSVPHLVPVACEGEIFLNAYCVPSMSRFWGYMGWGWGKKWSLPLGPAELEAEQA